MKELRKLTEEKLARGYDTITVKLGFTVEGGYTIADVQANVIKKLIDLLENYEDTELRYLSIQPSEVE